MSITDTGYGQRGITWSFGPGYYAVEDGAGGATLYSFDEKRLPKKH